MNLSGVMSEALEEIRKDSQKKIYRRDPEAWYADVLDGRWWSKQREIAWSFAAPNKPQTMTVVKSCNGIGKTAIAGDLATWLIATNDPMELSIIATAPIFSQIGTGLFRYINDNYNAAKRAGFTIPGRFVADPAIKVERLDGGNDKAVMQAKRPADNNLISSFQGIHDGIVAVFMDEAGGLPEDLWIGANAVTTNEYARILAIGNPDQLNTAFHRRFQDRERYRDWTVLSISAYESPNLTGEIIHPDPEKDKAIKSHLVQKSWVEMMERQAHPNVVLAKVHGEFPKDDASSFFPQHAMNTAFDTAIDPAEFDSILGVDLAFGGEDNTVIYENRGGHVRKVSTLLYEDNYYLLAQKIHRTALERAATEVRVDASGTGKGIYSLLETQPEFQDKTYTLVGLKGGNASPDNSQWAQFRSYMYDDFRKQMQEGKIDLDYDDREVREQMQSQTFKVNAKGAIQILPKSEMRSLGLTSPDELDAAIMSAVDMSPWTGKLPVGTVLTQERDTIPDFGLEEFLSAPGMPMRWNSGW